MVNFLHQLDNPQIKHKMFFEVLRDFRKGGLKPENYADFLSTIDALPPISKRTFSDYNIFDKFSLTDISQDDFNSIMKEVMKRGIEKSKFCWHPEASTTNCNVDRTGEIVISAAHSIQNNGVLSKIVKNGHVMSYALDKGEFEGN